VSASSVSLRSSRSRLGVPSLGSRSVVMGVLVLTSVYFLLPIWWLIVSSTKSNGSLFSSNGFWFDEPQFFTNLEQVFTRQDGAFTLWMANSLLYAGVGGFFATLFGAACGYALAKFTFRGQGLLFAAILAGVLVPSALLTVPLYLLFASMGIAGTVWSVLIPSMISPFAVYLARVYAAASIPDELIEAARVDGAGEIRIFATMALRIMSPALVTIFLFTFVGIWNNFFLPLVMLNNPALYPVTLGLFNWYAQLQVSNFDIVITGSLISVIPLVLGFLALQRFWRSGLTAGGIKS
jgi:multiple sugar transport system permease protein